MLVRPGTRIERRRDPAARVHLCSTMLDFWRRWL
jgi:hypothetical protein